MNTKKNKPLFFKVFLFTDSIPNENVTDRLLNILANLYGSATRDDDDYVDEYGMKQSISNFVYNKGPLYTRLSHMVEFNISTERVKRITEAEVDTELTRHENLIKKELRINNLPVELVHAPHGLGSSQMLLIALKSSNKFTG